MSFLIITVKDLKKRWKSIKDYLKAQNTPKPGSARLSSSSDESGDDDNDHNILLDQTDFLDERQLSRFTYSNIDDEALSMRTFPESQTQVSNLGVPSTSALSSTAFLQHSEAEVNNIVSTSQSVLQPRKRTKNISTVEKILAEKKETKAMYREMIELSRKPPEAPTSIILQYFQAFAAEIETLPQNIKTQCMLEIKLFAIKSIDKHVKLAEQQKQQP